MSLSWSSRERDNKAWPVWVVLCAYLLFGMTELSGVFALPWIVGRSDVLSGWVRGGYIFPIGAVILTIASATASVVYGRVREAKHVGLVVIAVSVIGVIFLTLAARGRVEVRANDLRVTWEDFRRADALYRVEHASQMVVSCSTGRKRKVYPSIEVLFFDGVVLDLTPLVLPTGNGPGREGLRMMERIDA